MDSAILWALPTLITLILLVVCVRQFWVINKRLEYLEEAAGRLHLGGLEGGWKAWHSRRR
jgi:hypothetical protein